MFHRRYGLKALVWTIALVVCSLAMHQYVAADETIVVRRGDQVHDVVISTDMTNQVQRWDDLHDRVVTAVTTYVVANKGYTSYTPPNFLFFGINPMKFRTRWRTPLTVLEVTSRCDEGAPNS